MSFEYDDESDPGPYPIPPNPPIEGGPNSTGDRHVLVVDRDNCVLYELFSAYPNGDGSWHAGSGAIFPLNSNALRPAGWTSADAAGLPVLAGLVRYDEVASGEISHALRFTASTTQRAYLWPARHYASSNTNPTVPPMGIRVRLKSNVDISGFSPTNRVILQALKTYGMFLADNGSNWFISGAPDSRWNDTDLRALRNVLGSSFEVVDESSLMINVNSGQAAQPGGPTTTPVPPTATRTATPVPPTATRTPTPAPPTATRTSTSVPTTATRTSTPAPATLTPTPTRTATPTNPQGGVAAQMVSPAPGSTFSWSTVTFRWTRGTGVSQYWLWIGSNPGDDDIYSQNRGWSRSATIHGLPTAMPLYVRLWSRIGGTWEWVDYIYGPGSS